MQFTRIPQPFDPLAGPLVYTLSDSAEASVYVRITNPAGTDLFGVKRFLSVRGCSFDIAPCLRQRVHFSPVAGLTGIRSATDRCVSAVVHIGCNSPSVETLAAPVRTFLPADTAVAAPTLLTSLPLTRTLPAGASDELTLLTAAAQPVTVIARLGDGSTAAQSYTLSGAGLYLFRLNSAEFEGAEQIRVDAGGCGCVEYVVTPPVAEACRLAWRSRRGSVEHYSFPVERSAEVEVQRRRGYGADGHTARTTIEQHRTLQSAFERREVLEPLAELLASPQVWEVTAAGYTPVDVLSDRAEVHRHGSLSTLSVTIRPKKNPSLPWN